LIEEYEGKNRYWIESANKLRNLKSIRNVLTHQRNSIFGYPIAVAPSSINALIELGEHLLNPEKVSMKFRKTVKMVCTDDSLVHVLILAFENEFSQFPVISHGQFGGLITENEITRWLGRRAKANSTSLDLAKISVRGVLKEKDTSLKGVPIFQFRSLDASVEEVMSQFLLKPTLEAILLTDSGDKHTAIEGIITQWDAARYPENG
jgi:predicted transcriptional regulator